jgi:uncharacterized protein (DUF3820 family)
MKRLLLKEKLPVGKYRGRVALDVCLFDPSYLVWLSKNGVEFESGELAYINEKFAAGPDPHAFKMEMRRRRREQSK